MQRRSRHRFSRQLILLAVSLLCAGAAVACGLFLPADCLVTGGSDPLALPKLSFEYEIYQILGQPSLIGPPPQKAGYDEPDPAPTAMVEKDASQLHDALLAASMPAEEVQRTLEEYKNMRTDMRGLARNHQDWEAQMDQRKSWAAGGYTPDYPPPAEPPAFELTAYDSLLTRLPAEFSRYARGAAAYQNHDYETALQTFTQILDLPPDQRPYRTVWAAYMRAMALLRLERFSDAMSAYTGIADLVKAGFADPLLLANESTGWIAHIKLEQGDMAGAVSLYLDCYAKGDAAQRQSAVLSLEQTLSGLDAEIQADQLDKLLGDERLREVLIAWRICCGDSPKKDGKDWLLSRLQDLPRTAPLPYTDRIAWLAYQAGDFDAAKNWLRLSPPDSPISMWVQSKLLLKDGKLPEAAEQLATLVKTLEQSQNPEHPGAQNAPKWYAYGSENSMFAAWEPARIVNLDLGMVLFKRASEDPKYYTGALDAFLKARSPFDAARVAEHNLPLDELVAYASALAPAVEDKDESYLGAAPDIRHLCARRLAREGALEKAIPFYPEALQNGAKTLLADLKEGRNPANPPWDRAARLVAAARATREQGMEFYGTALCPDWSAMNGEFDLSTPDMSWCNDNPPKPNKRYHYRYLAADLMWEAAQLLPNNDPLTATALYEGGTFLKSRDPEAAERFYKALVKRNPNLAVAQQADKLRWFPSDFDGSVAYRHPSRFPLTPRKIKALLAASLAVLLPAIVITIRRRKKPTPPPKNP